MQVLLEYFLVIMQQHKINRTNTLMSKFGNGQ